MLWSGQEGTHVTAFFAATYPERTLGLVLLDPSARATPSDDYPWAVPESEWMERLNDVRANWGKRKYFLRLLQERAPDAADDPAFQDWFVTHMRRSLSPGAAAAYFRTAMDADISDVLPAVRCPHPHPVLARAAGTGGVLRGSHPGCADPMSCRASGRLHVDRRRHARADDEAGAKNSRRRCSRRRSRTASWRRCCSQTSSIPRRSRRSSETVAGPTWRGAITRWSATWWRGSGDRAGHGRRRLLCAVRRSGSGGGVCPGDRARRPVTRDRGARGLAYRRVRCGRREVLRALRVDRRARGVARGNGRRSSCPRP